jgi:hypothetical protein
MGCSMSSIAESKSQRTLSYICLFAASSPSTLISFALLAFRSLALFLACVLGYPRPDRTAFKFLDAACT